MNMAPPEFALTSRGCGLGVGWVLATSAALYDGRGGVHACGCAGALDCPASCVTGSVLKSGSAPQVPADTESAIAAAPIAAGEMKRGIGEVASGKAGPFWKARVTEP